MSELKAKVVHLTTVHRADDVRVYYKEALTLAAAGFHVVLIAPADEMSKLKNVQVKPLPIARNRWERMTRVAWAAYGMALAEHAEIYHFHDPELIPVGLLLKLRGKLVVYDVHEDVSKDLDDKAYLPGWLKPMLRVGVKIFEYLAGLAFNRIVAATSSIEARFPRKKVSLIRNVPILDEMALAGELLFAMRPRNIVYVGGLAPFNGVEQMIRAMQELPEGSDIKLLLAGRFASEAQEREMRELPGWSRVEYSGWVDRHAIARLYASARAGLVVYQPTPNILKCEPNKFYEVLSAGLPIIASHLPHWLEFVSTYECGVVVPPSDPRAIAKAILEVVDNPDRAEMMGRNGRRVIRERYNWGVDGANLIALYRRLLSTGNGTARMTNCSDGTTNRNIEKMGPASHGA